MANEKYQTAEIQGRKAPRFQQLRFKCISFKQYRVAAVRLPISKQRVHLVRMHQACTHYSTSYYNMVSSFAYHVHVQSSSNLETQWSGPTPALPPSVTHWLMFEHMQVWDCWPHPEATQYSPCLKCSISKSVDTRSTRSVMKAQ